MSEQNHEQQIVSVIKQEQRVHARRNPNTPIKLVKTTMTDEEDALNGIQQARGARKDNGGGSCGLIKNALDGMQNRDVNLMKCEGS